ncbi:hypothetical protein PTSG_07836 [Salpingoeca rosetta]|uniref:Serine/threonine-protein kinase 19 n=1 Tax=Salpingoeca rosetta (strain ATCC 50818 / BSB-021) TaxID=946362 RepID=F2UGG9_SALR5|nr:uncharacterized protein PTSG_07836 [Salpingoeca rosetta]EGD75719.1 hypothetical protein PTSG_07836 [Salpingoeca rosetta]|eukprot:XP_004991640.1 hypothetical protein PTSG_07836 [Salpingoeca rosetta]
MPRKRPKLQLAGLSDDDDGGGGGERRDDEGLLRGVAAVVRRGQEDESAAGEREREAASGADDAERLPGQEAFDSIADLFPTQFFSNVLPPVVLQHQLFHSGVDPGAVERFVDESLKRGTLLKFELARRDAVCLVRKRDYVACLRRRFHLKGAVDAQAQSANEGGRDKAESTSVAQKGAAVPAAGRSIQDLVATFLQRVTLTTLLDKAMLTAQGFSVLDIPRLVQAGVLRIMPGSDGLFSLGLPNLGTFAKELLEGRKQLLATIRRKKYKEALRVDLEKVALKETRLPVQYHVLDVMGCSHIRVSQTTRGPMLRVQQHTAQRAVGVHH